MLILLNSGWPWLIFGSLAILFSLTILRLSPSQWLNFLLSLPFLLFTEPTSQEKHDAKHQPADEVATANPGCLFLLAGIIMLAYGCFRLIRPF